MDFKDKLLEQLKREDLTDNEARVNAIVEAIGEFVPKGKFNEISNRLHSTESEKNAIQSQLDNERKQKLTIEEQNSQRIQEILEKAEAREKQAAIRENSAEATEILIGAGLSKEDITSNNLLASLVNENREESIARANGFAALFKNQKAKVEEQVKKDYYNDNPMPPASNVPAGGDIMTREKFNKLTYSEELKFAQENPQLYAEFTK